MFAAEYAIQVNRIFMINFRSVTKIPGTLIFAFRVIDFSLLTTPQSLFLFVEQDV